jgi:hypothetical protein
MPPSRQRFYSWDAFDNPEGVDALSQRWDFPLAYTFPPIALLKRVVKKMETSRGTFILVSPLWEAQTWLALVLTLEGPGGSPPAFHGRVSDGSNDGQAAPDPLQPPSSRLEDLWRIHSLQDLPGNTKDILKAGWRQSTEDRYNRPWQSFKRHLRSANVPLDQVGVKHILNYIAHVHNLGLAYRTISLHRSTISMTLPYINGVALGSHPHVSRMCKGSFEKRPPPHKVPSVWDPTPVLDIFMHWHLPLSYTQLVRKCTFVLAILSGRRLSELFDLKCDVSHPQISNNFVQLVPASLQDR